MEKNTAQKNSLQNNAVQKRPLQTVQSTLQNDAVEIDLVELFGVLMSKWHLLLVGLLIGALLSGLYTYFMMTPKFTATSKLYMVSNSNDTIVDLSDFNIGNSLSSDYEQLLLVRPILESVIENEDLEYTYEELKDMLSLSTISNTRILQISAVSTSPAEAMLIANALADKAVEEIPVLMDTATPNIAERAVLPTEKSSPSLKRNVLLGGMLGLLLVGAVLVVLFLMDDTMLTAEDVQKKLGVMPLTVIPEGEIFIQSEQKREDKAPKKSKLARMLRRGRSRN